jgi:hypothetical protein
LIRNREAINGKQANSLTKALQAKCARPDEAVAELYWAIGVVL